MSQAGLPPISRFAIALTQAVMSLRQILLTLMMAVIAKILLSVLKHALAVSLLKYRLLSSNPGVMHLLTLADAQSILQEDKHAIVTLESLTSLSPLSHLFLEIAIAPLLPPARLNVPAIAVFLTISTHSRDLDARLAVKLPLADVRTSLPMRPPMQQTSPMAPSDVIALTDSSST